MANGILDIFTIGFKSDGLEDFEKNLKNTEGELKKTEREIKDLNGILKELAKNGNQDSKAFKQFQKELDDAKKKAQNLTQQIDIMKNRSEYQLLKLRKNFSQLVKTLGSLAFTGIALKKSLDFYEQGEQLEFLAQKTGVAADKLQLLANVAKKYGGTTEGTAGSLEGLNTKEGRQTAAQAGITITDDSEKNLENIARKMETLGTTAQKLELAKTLGLDEATTRMVLEGTTKLNEQLKQAKKYQLFTPEDIQRMREYRQIESDIRLGIENIFGSIWRMLLPAITQIAKILRKIIDWFVINSDVAKVIAIVIGVTAAVIALNTIMKMLNISVSAFSATILKSPLTWWILAITAVILALNDLYVFINGGDSIIGRLGKKWGWDLDALRKKIIGFCDEVERRWKVLLDLFNPNSEIRMNLAWDQKGAAKINNLKKTPKEVQKEYEQLQKMTPEQYNQYKMIKKAQQQIGTYNYNPLNTVPYGSVSNFNNTKTLLNNNNSNTQNLMKNTTSNIKNLNNKTSSTKNVNIQKVEINTQSTDGKGIYNQFLDTASGLDNGMRA